MYLYGRFKMFPESLLFLRYTTQYNHLSYFFSFKTVLLFNYKLLPATVNVFETFLAAILWHTFQLFRHILNDVSSITKALSLQC